VTTQSVYFQITSPLTGAADTLLDAVTVNTVRNIQISTNNSNTVYPGGTVDYVHIITNNGNVKEGDPVVNALPLTNAQANPYATSVAVGAVNSTGGLTPWTTQLFYDANNNGVLDTAEAATPITDLSFVSAGGAGLTPGESVRIFARVISNVNSNPGDSDVATVTVTTTGTYGAVPIAPPAAVFNTDTTSVIAPPPALPRRTTGTVAAACPSARSPAPPVTAPTRPTAWTAPATTPTSSLLSSSSASP